MTCTILPCGCSQYSLNLLNLSTCTNCPVLTIIIIYRSYMSYLFSLPIYLIHLGYVQCLICCTISAYLIGALFYTSSHFPSVCFLLTILCRSFFTFFCDTLILWVSLFIFAKTRLFSNSHVTSNRISHISFENLMSFSMSLQLFVMILL